MPSSEVRIGFCLCGLALPFAGKWVPNSAKGRGGTGGGGGVGGERRRPSGNRAQLTGLPFLFAQKGAWRGEAGSTTACLWPAGGQELSCLSNNVAMAETSPGPVCGATGQEMPAAPAQPGRLSCASRRSDFHENETATGSLQFVSFGRSPGLLLRRLEAVSWSRVNHRSVRTMQQWAGE